MEVAAGAAATAGGDGAGTTDAIGVATGTAAASSTASPRPATARATTAARPMTQAPTHSAGRCDRPTRSKAPLSSPTGDLRQLRSMKTFFVSV